MTNHKKGQVWAIFSLINYSVGSGILMIPILAIHAGYLLIPIIILIIGFLEGYTAWILAIHQNTSKSLRQMMSLHLQNSRSLFITYDIILIVGLVSGSILYFTLLVRQIAGLFPMLQNNQPWLSILVMLSLLILTALMKHFHFSIKVMGVGILGTLITVIFFISLIFSSLTDEDEAHQTAMGKVQPFGNNWASYSTTLIYSFFIHDLSATILVQTTQPKNFSKVIKKTFAICTLIYLLASYSLYGIVWRNTSHNPPQIIYDYFPEANFYIKIMYIVFSFHFLTILPQMVIVGAYLFFQLFQAPNQPFTALHSQFPDESQNQTQGPKHLQGALNVSQFIFYTLVYLVSVIFTLSKANYQTFSLISSITISLTEIFIFPLFIHFRCIYGRQSKVIEIQNGEQTENEFICNRKNPYKSRFDQIKDIVIAIIIFLVCGFCIVFLIKDFMNSSAEQKR